MGDTMVFDSAGTVLIGRYQGCVAGGGGVMEFGMKTSLSILAVAALVGFLDTAAHAQQLVLVEDGASPAPIIVFENAPPITRNTAAELAEYIEKISGARPRLIEGKPDPVPDRAIWVGYQPVLDSLFPERDFDFQHPEEIIIGANANHLVIAGRDRWDEDNLVVEGRNSTINGMQSEYGTANAVYAFLQKHLNVRWLWPGEMGEDIIEQSTITFEPFVYRYHPQLRSRSSLFRLSALGDGRGHSHDWARRQGLQLDSLNQPGGHDFRDWYERFHDTHPEYFALQPNGTRKAYPSAGNAKLCQSNPAIWARFVEQVRKKLKDQPHDRVFNGSPNDSAYSGICVCADCRAWDELDAPPVRYSWEGISQEYVALSDRYVRFANHLARELREKYPDRDYYVLMGAYGDTSKPAPQKAVPDDNVIISSVHSFQRELGDEREAVMQQFADWAKLAPHMVWRPNTGGAGWHVGLPDSAPRQVIRDMRFLAENNCKGIMLDTVWEHWATTGPHLYMLGRLTWNPRADGDAILADYYERGFGPAADEIEAYWQLMEDTRRELIRQDMNRYDVPKAYTSEVLDKADRLLQQAEEKAGDNTKYAERVGFVRTGLDYTRLLVRARALMIQMKEDGQDPQTVEKIESIWRQIRQVRDRYPKAFNIGFITSQQRWMSGFHPDHPR